jgi:hypothetical protein
MLGSDDEPPPLQDLPGDGGVVSNGDAPHLHGMTPSSSSSVSSAAELARAERVAQLTGDGGGGAGPLGGRRCYDDDEDELDGEYVESSVVCLFGGVPPGSTVYADAEEAYARMGRERGFDLGALRRAWGLDFYATIQLINFVRSLAAELEGGRAVAVTDGDDDDDDVGGVAGQGRQVRQLRLLGSAGGLVACLTPAADAPWRDQRWMTPVFGDDGLLTGLDDEDEDEGGGGGGSGGGAGALVEAEDVVSKLSVSAEMFDALSEISARVARAGGGGGGDEEDEEDDEDDAVGRLARSIGASDDRSYFESYSFIDIHESMLKDTARTEAYRDAMMANRALFEGANVIDVGCGTSILSIFAARAGAKRVVGIDASERIPQLARRIVAANGLEGVVEIVQGKVEELDDEAVLGCFGG